MNVDAFKSFQLKPIEHRYSFKDNILYALGLGYGEVPDDPRQLKFVYEKGQSVVPSVCVVLAHAGFWLADPTLEIDWVKILHGEQAFEIHRPIPPEGAVRGEYEVVCVDDKGVEKGAVLHLVKRLYDMSSDALLATVTTVLMLRGNGGRGGFGVVPAAPEPLPEMPVDITVQLKTMPQMGLIYRLSGDYNPIHADPEAARKAGFPRPILHGLCSMGLATRALISAVADDDPARLRSVAVRFSKPIFPGETVGVDIFKTPQGIRFRARAVERDIVVLDRGTAVLAA